MADDDSLQALEALHRDLCALIDNRMTTLDRLRQNLEDHLDDFKALVDKRGKNDQSRKSLGSGTRPLFMCGRSDADVVVQARSRSTKKSMG
jgi:hypothetical protein